MYDVIVVGAGPAGITAAVYSARKKLDTLVISQDIGGQTAWSGDIENYTGYQFITGADLTAKFEEHLKKFDVMLKEGEEVKSFEKKDDKIAVKTDKGEYETKTLIIASGKKSKELGVPGEREFRSKGLTYCATCDGPLFAGKNVAVVGGGNSGLEAAIQLMKIAKHVHLINVSEGLTGDEVLQEKVRNNEKVTILDKTKVKEVLGDKMVKAIKVERDGKEEKLDVEGVFVEIGLLPNSDFAEGLNKNKWKEIEVDMYNRTSVGGVFAAGDVTNVPEKQIIIAAGEGAKATLSAFKYVLTGDVKGASPGGY